ncbi:TROVE domain-containing protein [Jiangella endophytica]|uniref:TROVE domain-containing protein n=1 Tax=Jiangella endophytica TaxID=1623398 RepID=UPI000E357D2E|nr:TROVE domain-containing protein [Jiangella endophytica]
MSKFDRISKATGVTAMLTSPVRALRNVRTRTHEGAPAYVRDVKSELFLLAVTNLAGEDTFYESAADRDERFRDLVHAATSEDPEWVTRLVPWLRDTANLRSAPVVAAVEYVHAGGPFGRRVVDSALQRADEPAEVLAYYTSRYGRALPQPIKRGVADAARRLYTERAALKYDGVSRAWRMADVLELCHVRPRDEAQSALFRWLLDRRHGRAATATATATARLPVVTAHTALQAIPPGERRQHLDADTLAAAGVTWESLAGWLGGPLGRTAWEAIIPSTGYMALLRNLRNFDHAGVSDAVAERVAAKLADPGEVRRSRQFPFRFVAAYRNAPSLRWAYALDRALEAATANVPALAGRTLVLVDTSASMRRALSARSSMSAIEAAAVFGVALAKRGNDVDLYGFADGVFAHRVPPAASLLTEVGRLCGRVGEAGHGTRIAESLRTTYRAHDRVVIVTDLQTFPDAGGNDAVARVPAQVPVYGFNLGGYRPTVLAAGRANRHEFGGLGDGTFTMIGLLEEGRSAGWPF